jgi:hypothetical protein
MYEKEVLKPLPVNLQFFFSKLFLIGPGSPNFKMVKQHSFYSLYYPATFNALDRFRFIHLIIEFRDK